MKKVTGIGGVFFKCKDALKLKDWYQTHLGFDTNEYGATFEWIEVNQPEKKGATQWSTFPESTTYFDPSKKDFMINYRVENLEKLVEKLKEDGVQILDDISHYDGLGKFVHILDAEDNKIELWEPAE